MNKTVTLDLELDRESKVSAEELLRLIDGKRSDISKIKFQPPKLGDSSFGEFVVVWKNRRYGRVTDVR